MIKASDVAIVDHTHVEMTAKTWPGFADAAGQAIFCVEGCASRAGAEATHERRRVKQQNARFTVAALFDFDRELVTMIADNEREGRAIAHAGSASVQNQAGGLEANAFKVVRRRFEHG